MFDVADNPDFLSLVEINHLRREAIDLYDHCLAEGNPARLIKFIEQQLTYDPPQIQLLSDIANDIQQRLLTLNAYHFDVRQKVVNIFEEIYRVDITPLMPADLLETYHLIEPEQVVAYTREQGVELEEEEEIILTEMVRASRDMAGHLQRDILLTERLHDMILDWIYALSAAFARAGWQLLDWASNPGEQFVH
jgi:hypothetical protein